VEGSRQEGRRAGGDKLPEERNKLFGKRRREEDREGDGEMAGKGGLIQIRNTPSRAKVEGAKEGRKDVRVRLMDVAVRQSVVIQNK